MQDECRGLSIWLSTRLGARLNLTNNQMKLPEGASIMLHILRKNGAIEEIFTNKLQAEAYMRKVRKNGEFWRIQDKATVPQENLK